VSRGISVSHGRLGTDFGPRFYTTTDREVAQSWAATLLNRQARRIGVVSAELDRDSLATLSWLAFARGDECAHDLESRSSLSEAHPGLRTEMVFHAEPFDIASRIADNSLSRFDFEEEYAAMMDAAFPARPRPLAAREQ
jgi:hypothetical protein